MDSEGPRDSVEFWVRFVCGATVGSLLGLALWFWVFPSLAFPWIAIPVAMVLFGLAAARWGDRFWFWLLSIFRFY